MHTSPDGTDTKKEVTQSIGEYHVACRAQVNQGGVSVLPQEMRDDERGNYLTGVMESELLSHYFCYA